MPMPSEQSESENAYVLDAESATEMVRLTKQDQIITKYSQSQVFSEFDRINKRG